MSFQNDMDNMRGGFDTVSGVLRDLNNDMELFRNSNSRNKDMQSKIEDRWKQAKNERVKMEET